MTIGGVVLMLGCAVLALGAASAAGLKTASSPRIRTDGLASASTVFAPRFPRILGTSAATVRARLPRDASAATRRYPRRFATTTGGTISYGTPTTFTISAPNDTAWMTFSATGGTRVSMTTSMSGTWMSSILDPNGNTVAFCTAGCDNGKDFIEPVTLPQGVDGNYKVTLTSNVAASGTITLYKVADQTIAAGDPTPVSGTAVPVTISAPGQVATITFHGSENHTLSMTQNGNIGQFATTLFDSAGAVIAQCGSGCNAGSNFLEPIPLHSDTYKIVFDPKYNDMGTETLTLYDVPPDVVVNAATPTASGVTVTLPTTTPGQNAHINFFDTASRRLSWTQDGNVGVFGTGLSWVDPNGPLRPVTECGWNCGGGSKFLEPYRLPFDGSYRIDFNPSYYWAGTETIKLYDVVDVTGSLTVGGSSLNVNLPTPGQRALLTFDGAGGQGVTTVPTNNTIFMGGIALLGPPPANSYLGGSKLDQAMTFTLPPPPNGTGTYTVLIDPSYQYTGSLTIKVQGAPGAKDVPQITGKAQLGEQLTATGPSWAGVASGTTYQWQRCDAQGLNCVSVGIAGAGTYGPLGSADLGRSIRVVASASNTYGTGTATSLPTPDIIDEAALRSLAFQYRPALLFSYLEPYRPITVDSLLAERDSRNKDVHRRCDRVMNVLTATARDACELVGSVDEFLATKPRLQKNEAWPPIKSWLSIWPYMGSADQYHSPSNWPCGANSYGVGFRDCGNRSAIYYDFGQGAHFYRFLDYWFFYRYNEISNDMHEGDWEGVTVVLRPEPGLTSKAAVAGAIFWQHGDAWYRTASGLNWCINGGASGTSCDSSFDSGHAADFVGLGSHAAYEFYCPYNCTLRPLPDEPHGGEVGWNDNLDVACTTDVCLQQMTHIDGTATPAWVDWPSWDNGYWGGSGNDGTPIGNSPQSPGKQSPYKCTQAGWNCGKGLDGDPFPTPLGIGQASREKRAFSLGQCRTWYDAGLAGYACSPSELKKSAEAGRLGIRGHFRMVVRGRHTGVSAGLVQVIGLPLKPGTHVRFEGDAAPDEIIALNSVDKDGAEYKIELRHPRLRPGAHLVITKDGRWNVRFTKMQADVLVTRIKGGQKNR